MMERINRKNVLNYTTEYRDPLGQQKAETFHQVLTQLSSSLLYIHKMQIQTFIDKENYGLLATLPLKGTAKAITERIGTYIVEFHIPPMANTKLIHLKTCYSIIKLIVVK
jgi:hypothetical protein